MVVLCSIMIALISVFIVTSCPSLSRDPLITATIVAYSLPIHASVPSHAIIRTCVLSGRTSAPGGRLARLMVETAAPVSISARSSVSPASTTPLHSTAVRTRSRGTPCRSLSCCKFSCRCSISLSSEHNARTANTRRQRCLLEGFIGD